MTNAIEPKTRFLLDGARADAHQEYVLSPEFKAACESALLEYIVKLNTGADQMTAMRCGYYIEGAKGFLRVLLNLGDKTQEHYIKEEETLEKV